MNHVIRLEHVVAARHELRRRVSTEVAALLATGPQCAGDHRRADGKLCCGPVCEVALAELLRRFDEDRSTDADRGLLAGCSAETARAVCGLLAET